MDINQEMLVSHLAVLTGDLQPTEQTTSEDLDLARTVLAKALAGKQAEPLARQELMERLAGTGPGSTQQHIPANLAAIAKQTMVESTGEQPEYLVYRRELPVLTAQEQASLPLWADGRAIDRSLGPFKDALGRPTWIDIFHIVRQVTLVRYVGGVPFLSLPIQGLAFTGTTFPLGHGSLWFASQLLASSAPAGGYTGIRIKGGTLTTSQAISFTGTEVIVPPAVTCTLHIQLDPPVAPGGAASLPGADARDATCNFPAEVTLQFMASSALVQSAGPASFDAYGTNIQFSLENGSPSFVAEVNRILVPFKADLAQFTVQNARSILFVPDGTAPIHEAAWALPVAIANPNSLGAASGVGSLALLLEAGNEGLVGAWEGQARNLALGPAILMADPEQLSLVALTSRGLGTQQGIRLWSPDGTGTPTSRATLTLPTPFPLRYFSQASGAEALLAIGSLTPNLDRPLTLDGLRLPLQSPQAAFILIEQASNSIQCLIFATLAPPKDGRKALAFAGANIVMKSSPPIILELYGHYDGRNVTSGALAITFRLMNLLPTLPDPYASNYPDFREFARGGANLATLIAQVGWAPHTNTSLSFAFSPIAGRLASLLPGQVSRSTGISGLTTNRTQSALIESRALENPLAAIMNQSSIQGGLMLLDVSTNADWFGIHLGAMSGREGAETGSSISDFVVQDMYLQGPGLALQVVTVPEVQWEPVATPIPVPDDPTYPPFLTFPDSGGPSILAVETVALVRAAPLPALDQYIKSFNDPANPQQIMARFTLPFGIIGVARLNRPQKALGGGAEFNYNRPSFSSNGLEGGHQVSIQANRFLFHKGTPGLEGAAVQLRNGLSSGLPANKSILDDDVDTIFNNNFLPGHAHAQVPVTRIDLSGYGESLFSDWRNPEDAAAIVSQVRFDVLIGRTAYEVVQVRSILYPYAVRVVRTITIERLNSGTVVRHDSGWQAATDGNYQYPDYHTDPQLHPSSGISTHPGVVQGIRNVTNIRDTGQTFTTTKYGNELMAVRFDGNVEIEGVVKGGTAAGVPARDQLGYVQLSDTQNIGLLDPDEYTELIARNGPLGGIIDCLINIGGSGQLMRVTRVGVGSTQGMGGSEFVMTAWGSPLFPKGGQWSFLKQFVPGDAPQPVDQDLGVPLVRAGLAPNPPAPTSPYRFADPLDLAQPDNPASDYGILHATGTQRVFFPRPEIEGGTSSITSTQIPAIADPYTLATALGLFPRTADAIPFPSNNWSLAISPTGDYKLVLPSSTFPAGVGQRTISNASSVMSLADYTNATVEIAIDTAAAVPWLFRLSKVSLIASSSSLGEIMRVTADVDASSGTFTRLKNSQLIMGGPLGPVEDIMTFLQSLGLPAPLDVSMTNTLKFKAGLKIPIGQELNKLLPPGGPQFIDTSITVRETIQSPISEAEFQLGAGIMIPTPFNPLKAIGLVKLAIKLSTKTGTTFTLTWGVGLGVAIPLGPFNAKAYYVQTMFLIVGDTTIGLGVGAIIKAGVDLVIASVDISIEFKMAVLQVTCASGTTLWGAAKVTFAIDITIAFVIDIDFEVSAEMDQQLSGGSCPLPGVL